MFFVWIGIGLAVSAALYILLCGLRLCWDVQAQDGFTGVFRGYAGRICLFSADIRGRLEWEARSGDLWADVRAMGIIRGQIRLEMAHLAYRGSGSFRIGGAQVLHVRLTMGQMSQPRLWFRPGRGAWYEVLRLDGGEKVGSPGGGLMGRILSRMSALEAWDAVLEIHGGNAPAALALGVGLLQSGLSAAEEALRLRNPGARIRFAAHPVFDEGKNRCESRGIFSLRMGHLRNRINAERKSA